jgi:hypothetical protein
MVVKITNCKVQKQHGLVTTRNGQNISLVLDDDFFDDITENDFINYLKTDHDYNFCGLLFNTTNSSKLQKRKEYVYLTPEQKLRNERKEKIKQLRKA